ncbi:hypothetical protein GGR53DRAFT_517810 [Hypoxylon sp. FL1150]|nr:hypothetical protein GGR53DRAFT_517810 [Hypoxylon sp. FL1150]
MSSSYDPETWASLPHDNHAGDTIASVVLCLTLATVAVCLRLYTRYFILNKFWFDDILAIIGLMGSMTNGIVLCVHTKYGLGAHVWDLDFNSEQGVMFFKMFYINSITYNTSLMLIKCTLFLQYYRLIQEVPHYRKFYLVVMSVVTGWVISQEFVLVFACTPIESYWNHNIDGTCLNSNVIGWMNAIGNLVTDLVILLLPIPVVWRLNLNSGRKWAVLGIFGLGFFTCIISICRMVFFAKLSDDISWDLVAIAAWGEAESSSGLICSSLIALGPLIRRFSRRFHTDKKSSGTPRNYTFAHSNPFSRQTTNRDKTLLRTNVCRKPFDDGSETELNRIDLGQTRKSEFHDDGRSIRSTKSSGIEPSGNSEYSETMPDLRLNLETGIRTIISTGNRESFHSKSNVTSNGIVVKQVWSVRNKEPNDRDDRED